MAPRGFAVTWVSTPGLMLLRLDVVGHPVGEARLVLPDVRDYTLVWTGDAYAFAGRVEGKLSLAVFGPDGALRGSPQPLEIATASVTTDPDAEPGRWKVPWGACLRLDAARSELPVLGVATCDDCSGEYCGALVLDARLLEGIGTPRVETRALLGVAGDAAFWLEPHKKKPKISIETTAGITRVEHPEPGAEVVAVHGARALLFREGGRKARLLNAGDLANPAVSTFELPGFDVAVAAGTDAGTLMLVGRDGDAVVANVSQCR